MRQSATDELVGGDGLAAVDTIRAAARLAKDCPILQEADRSK
jgi:hypothetical protein